MGVGKVLEVASGSGDLSPVPSRHFKCSTERVTSLNPFLGGSPGTVGLSGLFSRGLLTGLHRAGGSTQTQAEGGALP